MSLENQGLSNELPLQAKKEYDLSKGAVLKANQDMAFLGIAKGDRIEVKFDGEYLKVGPLGWDAEQLTKEINDGVWTLEKEIK